MFKKVLLVILCILLVCLSCVQPQPHKSTTALTNGIQTVTLNTNASVTLSNRVPITVTLLAPSPPKVYVVSIGETNVIVEEQVAIVAENANTKLVDIVYYTIMIGLCLGGWWYFSCRNNKRKGIKNPLCAHLQAPPKQQAPPSKDVSN